MMPVRGGGGSTEGRFPFRADLMPLSDRVPSASKYLPITGRVAQQCAWIEAHCAVLPDALLVRSLKSLPFALSAIAKARFTVLVSRSEEHTSELQSLMRISYAVFCLKKKNYTYN